MAQVITQAAANESVWNSFTIIQAIGVFVTVGAFAVIVVTAAFTLRGVNATKKSADVAAKGIRS